MDFKSCPECEKGNRIDNSFCVYCGASLLDKEADSGDAQELLTGDSGVDEQSAETDAIHVELVRLRQDLVKLEQRLEALRPPHDRAGLRNKDPDSRQGGLQPEAAGAGSVTRGPMITAHDSTAPRISGAQPAQGPSKINRNWINDLGLSWEQIPGNWFTRIGALALIIGVGFFLALAFDNGWIGPIGQVALGIVVSLALLGASELYKGKYPVWAYSVAGAGISILYISLYATIGIYSLLPLYVVFGLLVLVTILGGTLSLRYNSLALAVLAIIGGFATLLIIDWGDFPPISVVVPYILILDLGILLLAAFKNWRWLTILGAIGSYLLYGLWVDASPIPRDLTLQLICLSLIFLVFVGATSLFHIIWKRIPERVDLGLMTANAAAYFVMAANLLDLADSTGWLPLIALTLALLYGGIAYGLIKRSDGPFQQSLFPLAIALVFLTISIPLQISDSWVTIAWAIEGAVLVALGFYVRNNYVRGFGLSVLFITVIRLLVFDTWELSNQSKFVLNERMLTFVLSIVAIYVSAFLYLRYRQALQDWEEYIVPSTFTIASFLSLWIISAEIIFYFDHRNFSFNSENAKNLTLTLVWALYAGVVLGAGAVSRSYRTRIAGMGLFSIVILKLFLIDTFLLESGYRVVAYLVLGTFLISIGFFYQKYSQVIKGFFLGDKISGD